MSTKADLAERDIRLRRTREAMAQAGLDAIVLSGKGHWWGRGYFRYYTDYHLWSHEGLLLIPLTGDPVLSLSSTSVAERIAGRGWVTDARGDADVVPAMVTAIKEKGLAKGRIGLAGLKLIMPVGTHRMLTEGLPDVTFADADRLVDRVRMLKSPLEIQQNHELWELAKAAMSRFAEALRPGLSERDLAAESLRVVGAGGGRDTLVWVHGNPPEDVPVDCTDILGYHMEICGESGHWCELTLTCAFRDPSPLELKLMESELRAYEEIRKIAKPGARISDMANTFEQVLMADGWQLAGESMYHHDFHGQGMDWLEWPFYAALDTSQDAVLEEGMVFSYHPSREVLPAVRGTGINENMMITANGGERLSGNWDLHWRPMSAGIAAVKRGH